MRPVTDQGLACEVLGGVTHDAARRRRSEWARRPETAIFLLAAIAAALLVQGGFFARGQIAVAGLLAASVVTVLPVRRAVYPELRLPLVAGGLLAGWMFVCAVPAGSFVSAGRAALLLVALGTVLMLCRRLNRAGHRLVLAGLLGSGVLLAAVGWVGVVWRLTPWALPAQGLWRAASTITYANATAAVLVSLTLTALALLSNHRRSLPLGLILTVLLVGVAATLSRAGGLALVTGLGVLVLARGWNVLRVLVAPLVGAAIAFLGLLPSLPEGAHPRPGIAVVALVGGLGLTALLLRRRRERSTAVAAAVLLLAMLPVGLVVGSAPPGNAALRVWNKRANTASLTRSATAAAALRLVARHPVTGVGPGRVLLRVTDAKGRLRVQQYIHNEYLQVLTEAGAIAAALLGLLLVGVARLLWRSRSLAASALWAGVAAACAASAVHAGFDFIWHVPAVPLTMAALVGLVISPVGRPDEPAG
jgi:hypothetical protein